MAQISVSLPSDGDTIEVTDYNTPITTVVNEINGGLDNSNIDDAAAIAGSKLADDAITATKIDWASTGTNGGIWWEELGRTTLGSSADVITVNPISARKYLKILIHLIDTGGTINCLMTLNNDTGSNYALTRMNTNAAGTVSGAGVVSQANLLLNASTVAANSLYSIDVINVSAVEKPINGVQTEMATAGAANNPVLRMFVGKWANTSAQITRIDITNTGTGSYNTGSEVVVLGHN
jgi:hypothetical protein